MHSAPRHSRWSRPSWSRPAAENRTPRKASIRRPRRRRSPPRLPIPNGRRDRRSSILGDSLTAGYGLLETQAFPSVLQKRIDAEGYEFEVVNAGVSGDTSAGGLRRLDWALQGNVRILVVALGANDGLRGLPVAEMKKNLTEIINRGRAARRDCRILAGMEAPPNYGPSTPPRSAASTATSRASSACC